MKIQSINKSINNQNYTAPYAVKRQQAVPHFTGTPLKLSEQIMQELPGAKTLEKLKNAEWLKGEAGSILITALGTGLVAPIFIGFNPFVKAPKNATPEQKQEVTNTKLYTAMRQPISAALAVLFQLSALKPIDKYFLDKLVNEPELAKNFGVHVDQSVINSKSYVEEIAKKELKKQGTTKPSIFKYLVPTNWTKKNYSQIKDTRKNYDDTFKAKVKTIQDNQIEKVTKDFLETGKIKIGKRYLDNHALSELINKEIDNYIIDAQKLKIDNKGLAYYTKRAKVLIDNEEHLREIFKDIPVQTIKHTKPENTEELKQLYKQTENHLKDLLAKETNDDVKHLLKEILERPEDIRANRVSRTLSRIDTIKEMCGGNYSYEKYMEAMSKRNSALDNIITKLSLAKVDNSQVVKDNAIDKALKSIANNCKFDNDNKLLKSILHDTDTFDNNIQTLTKKIHKDIVKGYKKLTENTYKPFNQAAKIFIGVAITLPITCNALNWVYPRFMEIVFPRLSGVKKPDNTNKGGNK